MVRDVVCHSLDVREISHFVRHHGHAEALLYEALKADFVKGVKGKVSLDVGFRVHRELLLSLDVFFRIMNSSE